MPRIFRDQPVCAACRRALEQADDEPAAIDPKIEAVRREALAYESREDVARRMGGQALPVARPYVQVIEQTSKKWKIWKIWATILLVLGIIVAMLGAESEGGKFFAFLLILAGTVCYMIGAFGAWWHHG
jgi:hypothetical protein